MLKQFAIASSLFFIGQAQASTLDQVQQRDRLYCGVTVGVKGFSSPDDFGNWQGIDVDMCKAVAAAVLGDASKVSFFPLTSTTRFSALTEGDVDIVARNSTWTQSRDTAMGISFAGVNYYDGQGFLVMKNSGYQSVKDLAGATICTVENSTSELNLADHFRATGIDYKPLILKSVNLAADAFDHGRCDAYSYDLSSLYSQRSSMSNRADVIALPELISKEPLGPLVREGDDQWLNIVRWSLFAMINAEEAGVTQQNVDSMKKSSTDQKVRRLLANDIPRGRALGLNDDWPYQIIKQVGNYGESFSRHLGEQSDLRIDRGINSLWTDGGLMYAMPMR